MWLVYSALSVVFFTSLNLLQRVISLESKYPRALAVIFNFYASIISLIIFISFMKPDKLALPKNFVPWILVTLAITFYSLFERLRFKVAQSMDASIMSTVSTVGIIVAFFSSALFYKESLDLNKIIGFVLIIVSIFVVSYSKKSNSSIGGLPLGIFAFVLLGLGWSLDKSGANYFSPDIYNIIIWTIPTFLIFLPYVKKSELIYEIKTGSWKIFVLSLLNVVGYLLQLKALEIAEATKVIPIVQTSILATVILGILLLKEKENISKKIIAGVAALAGVILLV